ncbi:FxSxx-COOH system tetratricopeptide repeat protein [Acrocarpospora catenulata]|uniref:FxSxx-COOH system tetratricopeptide repeat protein n=1 Tax=Acrocarpospora catenulata TaxID=2836182 RepID=UPI002023ABCB|nr:FxSxx-COOH system tetratricopeptide repeat protein [Acrocarpospora catenulata]
MRDGIGAVTAVLPQAQALHGLGGVGKTQLAVEYAWRYRAHYDLVAWISADQTRLVPAALAALAPALRLPSSAATGIPTTARAVRDALERGEPYRRWLLIFDNAEEPEDIREFIPRGAGHVLITSRNPRWDDYEKTLRVEVFQRSESVAFLDKRLLRAPEPEVANLLAVKLGDLPLALEQAGAYQAQTGITAEEYIELLDEQTSRLLDANRAPGYPMSMTAVWQLSVAGLRSKVPEAIEVLRCCAFFGPEPIPRAVFKRGASERTPKLQAILSDPILRDKIFRELGRFALTRLDATAGTLQVHRLVQALLREELTPEEQEMYRAEVHMLLAGAAPKDPDDTGTWAEFAALFAHVKPSDLIVSRHPEVRAFAIEMVRYLHRAGIYHDALGFLDELLQQWIPELGSTHPDVLAARRHRGNVLRVLGRYAEAYETNGETLEQMRRLLPPNSHELLWMSNSFGADLRSRGDFHGARELDEESETAFIAAFGEESPHTLRLRNSIALDYALTSDYERARNLHATTYVRQEERSQEAGRASVLISWNNLARVVRLLGDYAEACDLGEEAYEYGIREFTADHPLTLLTAKDLAIARRRKGDLNEALSLATKNHEQYQQTFGDRHPETMAAAINVSNTLRTLDRIDEAFQHAATVLPRYPDVFGADHPFTLGCRVNIALLHRLRGEADRALELNTAILARLTERLGPNHDYTLTCAHNHAGDLAELGRHTDAIELGRQTYDRSMALFGELHYMTLCCAANLALDLRSAGAEKESDLLREQVLERYGAAVRMGHPDANAVVKGLRIEFDFDPPPI